MKPRILFLENQAHYKQLGISVEFSKLDAEFGGMANYKLGGEELRSYDAVVSVLYHSSLANHIIAKAMSNGVLTILVSDGLYDWANATENPVLKSKGFELYLPVLHDVLLVVGEDEADFFESQLVKSVVYTPGRVLPSRSKIDLPSERLALITTANSAYFDEQERERLLVLIRDTVKKLDEKRVPYCFRIFDRYLSNALNLTKENNLVDGGYDSVLERCSIVFTTPSSVSLSSMYHERLVCHFVYRDTPQFCQAAWNVLVGIDPTKTIDSLLSREKNRLDFQRYVVEKYFRPGGDVFEDKLFEALNHRRSQFLKTNYNSLIDSPFNFNLEYRARIIWGYIKKTKIGRSLSGFVRK